MTECGWCRADCVCGSGGGGGLKPPLSKLRSRARCEVRV